MQKKSYKIPKKEPTTVEEPDVAYQKTVTQTSSSGDWNPNVPFHGTQDEWWKHFHKIEEGEFTSLEEANREFEAWKKEYLINRLK